MRAAGYLEARVQNADDVHDDQGMDLIEQNDAFHILVHIYVFRMKRGGGVLCLKFIKENLKLCKISFVIYRCMRANSGLLTD